MLMSDKPVVCVYVMSDEPMVCVMTSAKPVICFVWLGVMMSAKPVILVCVSVCDDGL